MPAPSGTASLILGAVALAAVIYLYVVVQKLQKELQSSQSDVKTIAAHLEEEVHPAVEVLREQQGELRQVLSASRAQQMLASCGPQEEDIAQAMLRSMMGVSMRQVDHGQSATLAAEIESIDTDEEEDGPYEDEEDEEDEEEEPVDETEEYEA